MNQDQIRNIYDLIQKGQFQLAVKQCTSLLSRIKTKFKDGVNNHLVQEMILQLISLRGLSYSRMGNDILAEGDIGKVMKIKPLNEDIIIIVWHYYIVNGSFQSYHLKELANYLQEASSMNILSEQFEIDILSLLYYLKEFNTMKILCNKLLKKHKNPYFLALSILTSLSIYQSQPNNYSKEDLLLKMLVNKYLSKNCLKNEPNLHSRRVTSMIYLIKLYILRQCNEAKNYFDCIEELSTPERRVLLYPCIDDTKIQMLKNLMILQSFELSSLNHSSESDLLISHCKNILVSLIKNFNSHSPSLDWDHLRIFKVFIVKIFKEILKQNKSCNSDDTGDSSIMSLSDNLIMSVNSSLNLQSSQSTQITNSSSFQTQSTITSLCGNLSGTAYLPENDPHVNLFEKILAIININNLENFGQQEEDEDGDDCYYQGKNRLSLFLLTELKGRLVLLELYVELLHCIKVASSNTASSSNYGALYENLLRQANSEIIRLIDSNNINIAVDLKVSLYYYFSSNLNYNEDNIVQIILADLKLLLTEDILDVCERRNLSLDFFTSRMQILTMFNQMFPKLSLECGHDIRNAQTSLNVSQILSILKNCLNKRVTGYFAKENNNKRPLKLDSYARLLTSISLYCLSISRKDTESGQINPTGLGIFVLAFLNNHIADYNADYFVSSLLSEILPVIGSFSISHHFRNNILKIKRSQISTLNVYGNYLEMLSSPFIHCMNNYSAKSSEMSIDSLYSLKSNYNQTKASAELPSSLDSSENTKLLFNSYLDIHNELRETSIESLREDSFSLENLFEACKISQEISSNLTLEMLFCLDLSNHVFSLLLNSLSTRRSDNYLNAVLSLFDHYKPSIQTLRNANVDILMDNLSSKPVIRHDLSPIINNFTPIYGVEYCFSKVSRDLIPSNLFSYSDNLSVADLESITSTSEFDMEILKFVNGVPKLRYILIQRLRMWLAPLLLMSDLTPLAHGKLDENLSPETAINSFKEQIVASKYAQLIPNFDIELFTSINLQLMSLLFKIVNSSPSPQKPGYSVEDVERLVDFINTRVSDFSTNCIVRKINDVSQAFKENQPTCYSTLQELIEKINLFMFGPIFIITLIQSWLICNCSKKQVCSIYKALNKSHTRLLQEIYDSFKKLADNFNGTAEVVDYQRLCNIFDSTEFNNLKNNNHFNLNSHNLVSSQLANINNVSSCLNLIINSLENSFK